MESKFQGWSTATNHRLGSLIYKSLVSERETPPSAKYLPYSKLSMTRWIRPRRLPARGGSRVVWEKTLLASHPAKYTCVFTSMLDHSVGGVSRMSFCTLDVNSTSQRRVWIWGIRTKHVSQRCRLITSKYVESGHETRSRIQSGRFRFASRPWNARALLHFAAKQIMSNPRALRLLSGPGPGAGKQ